MRVGHPIQHQQQGLFTPFQKALQSLLVERLERFTLRHHALMAPPVADPFQSLTVHLRGRHTQAFRQFEYPLQARIVAVVLEQQAPHPRRIALQKGGDRMQAKNRG